jgi:hypothetical protein
MLSLLLLVGCAGSNIAARRQAHATDYAAMTAQEQASVDRGQLRQGMSTNAVLIAWGQPGLTSTMVTPNGPFVIWEYYRKRAVATPAARREVMVPWSPTPVPENRLLLNAPPAPSTASVEELERSAVFHNQRLVNWSPK